MPPDVMPNAARGWPWPMAAYMSDDLEWVTYLHQAYYLLGMLWAVGQGDQAIAALCDAARDLTAAPSEAAR
jgi:hypothetical protein